MPVGRRDVPFSSAAATAAGAGDDHRVDEYISVQWWPPRSSRRSSWPYKPCAAAASQRRPVRNFKCSDKQVSIRLADIDNACNVQPAGFGIAARY